MEQNVQLQEYIHPQMDILFVALNAPEVSNSNKHWFSYNLSFWKLLFRAGIITQHITDCRIGDKKVFGSNAINFKNWVIGVTDLNREIVATNSRDVSTNKSQVERILAILKNNPTKKLCIMHAKVAEEFEKQGYIMRNYKVGENTFGKVGAYRGTIIYEVPFHSGNNYSNKERFYKLLIS
jgi:hypothetical protein